MENTRGCKKYRASEDARYGSLPKKGCRGDHIRPCRVEKLRLGNGDAGPTTRSAWADVPQSAPTGRQRKLEGFPRFAVILSVVLRAANLK